MERRTIGTIGLVGEDGDDVECEISHMVTIMVEYHNLYQLSYRLIESYDTTTVW